MAELVASRYANALFDVGIEENKTDLFLQELKTMVQIFKDNSLLFEIYKSPTISKKEKKTLIDEAFLNRLSDQMLNFLKILIDKDRMEIFYGILNEFEILYKESKNIVEAVAVTAVKLDEIQMEKIKTRLSQMTGKNVILQNQIDDSILGGVLIKIGNEEIDGTIKGKLNRLREELAEIKA